MSESGTFLGRPVRSLQTMLRVISRAIPEIPPVIPDGVYGQSTMRAVTALQRYADLPVTGVVDQATWDKIVSMYDGVCEDRMPLRRLRADGAGTVPGSGHGAGAVHCAGGGESAYVPGGGHVQSPGQSL